MPGKRPPGPGRGHRVKQGSGIPAGGAGWGGPARGAGVPFSTTPKGAAKVQGKIRREALRLLLEGDIPQVAETWRAIMNDPAQPASARIAAAEKIRDEVLGKLPVVQVNAEAGPLDGLTDDDLERGINELRARLAGADGSREGTPPN